MNDVPGKGNRQSQYDRRYYVRRHWLDSIKIASGCKDCGISGPPEVLTFDHIRGEKKFGVGSSWNQGRQALLDEMAKCEIVCSNCHAIRTKSRGGDGPRFVPFSKIPRLSRECFVSEKIDGTNGVVWVDGEGEVWAGSKNRWLSPGEDNYGFAAWVEANKEGFRELGPKVWRGEWWGSGIQRRYGLSEKRFSLFDVSLETVPACCSVVPVLFRGEFCTHDIDEVLQRLAHNGSAAAPGFMRPEGIVVYHTAAGICFKKTILDDSAPKSQLPL